MKDEVKSKAQLIKELQDLRRKVAQYELKERNSLPGFPSQERYRTLFEDAPVSLWEEDFSETKGLLEQLRSQGVLDIHRYLTQHPEVMETCLSKLRVLSVNQATLDLFGARDLSELLQYLPQTFTKRSLCTFQHALVSLAERRLQFEEETALRTLTGELRHVLLRSFASSDDLSFSHVIVTMIDITKQKRTEEQLRESEEKFRLIAENTSDGILVIDHEKIVYTSPAYNNLMEIAEHERAGLGPDEIAALIHPDDRERIFADVYAAIAQQRSELRYVYRTVTGTGTQIWREDHARFVYDQHGRYQKSYVVCRDITRQIKHQEEARQREYQIQRANKLASLGVLVSGIAHEINNPNNFISLNISTLREYLAELLPFVEAHEQHREFLGLPYPEFRQDLFDLVDDMEYGSQRISDIVADLRDYSQQRSEKQWEWVDVQRVIEKAYSLCQGKIRKTVASFDTEFPEDLECIYTDQHALEQIVINLLINATQAMDKADTGIRVRVAANVPEPKHIQIEITDNGCGIEQDCLDKIFDPFYTTKPLGEGVGLGLYICHNLLTGIGGKLEVESTVGLGSTFRVILAISGPEGEG